MICRYKKHRLQFKFLAGTSRGTMKERDTYFVFLSRKDAPQIVGVGEISPLSGLSLDFFPHLELIIQDVCKRLENTDISSIEELFKIIPTALPAVRFGFETAFLDLQNGGKKVIFENEFSSSQKSIPINGLVWMGDFDFMNQQLEKKLEEGFDCIKLKIGAIDFKKEKALLQKIRERFGADKITVRVDANGAFAPSEALRKLEELSKFDIHSIEQPIATHQWQKMKELCLETPVPIALDEELIPHHKKEDKIRLLEAVSPQYIIFKPTLLGGLKATAEWIELAEERNIGWWMTSALEANIGLNAISQFTAEYKPSIPQGLGTGQLYHNNLDSPLEINKGSIFYDQNKSWEEI